MARITTAEVKNILNTSLDDPIITEHMNIAGRFVTDVLTGKGLGVATLRDIELYVSAHLISIRDQAAGAVVEEKIGETSVKYGNASTIGQGLAFTRYGQTAVMLDTSGNLAERASGKTKALFTKVGA